MTKQRNILSLPVEILREICSYLTYDSMCSLMLVCRGWREVGEEPWLWRSFPVIVDQRNVDSLDRSLGVKRLGALETLQIRGGQFTKENILALFKTVSQKQALKCLEIETLNISIVEPIVIADTLTGLVSVALKYSFLSKDQLTALFDKMLKKSNLTKLWLYNVNLEHIKPEVFSKILNNLEDVGLYDTELTDHQVAEMFKVMNKETRLKSLQLHIGQRFDCSLVCETGETSYTLASVDCQVFAENVNKLQQFAIYSSSPCDYITQEQVTAMLAQCMVQTSLKTLCLTCLDLSHVAPAVLASCVNKLETADLSDTKLTRQQVVEVFRKMDRETKLKVLKLTRIDVSAVDPDTLADCVDRLKTVKMSISKMTSQQIEKLLQQCPVKAHRMLWKGKNDSFSSFADWLTI